MVYHPLSRSLLFAMTAAAVILPIAVCLLAATSVLLGGMGDAPARAALGWIAMGVGVVWVLALISLVLVLAICRLAESEQSAPRPEEEDDQDVDVVS